MDDGTRDLLIRGMAAARDGDAYEARRYLERALNLKPDPSTQVEAWYWLSRVSTDPKEKRNLLEEILATRPTDSRARRDLAILDGRLDPNQIVNPDQLPRKAPTSTSNEPQRFTCPTCGGRLTYTPDGSSLICESCVSRQRVKASREGSSSPGHDFVVEMSTSRGHITPQATRIILCQACGAEFWLAPEAISLACPYCNTVYVLEQASTRDLIAPDGLLPFVIEKTAALSIFESQLRKSKKWVTSETLDIKGIYQPAWSFSIAGEVPWKCKRYQNRRWVDDAGSKILYFRDIVVAATPRLQKVFPKTIPGYRLDRMVAFDPRYLANWQAETYQVTMSEASLNARENALAQARQQIQASFFDRISDLVVLSTQIAVESFRLILLPVWIANRDSVITVNGQTGQVFGDHSPTLSDRLRIF